MPASTIRYWEQIGILPRPARVSGQRRYAEHSLNRIALLRLAQVCGFRLDEMRQLLYGFTRISPHHNGGRKWPEKNKRNLMKCRPGFTLCVNW